jgi:exodeoxyribonuclease V alpha subunit
MPDGLHEDEREELFSLALALLAARREGSSALPLPGSPDDPDGSQLDQRLARLGLGSGAGLARSLLGGAPSRLSPAVGDAGAFNPLVAADGALWPLAAREQEGRLAERIRARLASADLVSGPDAAAAVRSLKERPSVRAARPVVLTDEQESAVVRAATRRLTVVTGGPGTGKTSVAVSVLRTLARLGVQPCEIALAAPTGKAAARLHESVRTQLAEIVNPSPEDAALRDLLPASRTLHRLLGFAPSLGTFRHHENNPLPEKAVVVDESSMIDLALFDRLLRAVSPGARLVLLGDADQLPSVEAGAVFRDLVPGAGAGASDPRLRACVVLGKSWRMDASDPAGRSILEAAGALKEGRAGEAGAEIRTRASELGFRGVEILEAPAGPERSEAAVLSGFLARWYERHVLSVPALATAARKVWTIPPGPGEAAALEGLFSRLESFRLLCVTRGEGRPTGAAAVASVLHGLHGQATRAASAEGSSPRFLPGEPVLVTENDYERSLFNGDQGVVLRVRSAPPGAGHRYMAVFRAGDGWIAHPIEALAGRLELAWAVTVHRAQGSEYDSVALVLPAEEGLPIVTRELLYTAVTRARSSVVLVGKAAVLAAGAKERVRRFSRLAASVAVPPAP